MSRIGSTERRRYLRYPPDKTKVVFLQLSNALLEEEAFKPEVTGLVCEESHGGLCIVTLAHGLDESIAQGTACVIQLPRFGLQAAEVRWREPVDADLVKLGLKYL